MKCKFTRYRIKLLKHNGAAKINLLLSILSTMVMH